MAKRDEEKGGREPEGDSKREERDAWMSHTSFNTLP